MQHFKINMKLLSSIMTPFHSDTLWGHICWALRYTQGEEELLDFLECYDNGEPPLVISSAFPKGYLPFPVLEPMVKTQQRALSTTFGDTSDFVTAVSAMKKLFGTKYISQELLIHLNEKSISNYSIAEILLKNPRTCPRIAAYLPFNCAVKYKNGKIACSYLSSQVQFYCPSEFNKLLVSIESSPEVTYHAKINRLSGTAIDGGLFTTNDNFYSNNDFEAYCKIGSGFSEKILKECLEFINVNGFGRKKSTGKGAVHCTIERTTDDFVISDAFMTLSNYVPCQDDPQKGFYKLLTKYGKLGGHFASSSIIPGSDPTPFKYPIVMFESGSVFKKDKNKEHYGQIVKDVHSAKNINIVHYGMAYPMPLKIEGLDD
jgi:CRISPR-associated protein Csm4